MAIHSSTVAWKIPQTEEPGRLQSIGLPRIRLDLSDLAGRHSKYLCGMFTVLGIISNLEMVSSTQDVICKYYSILYNRPEHLHILMFFIILKLTSHEYRGTTDFDY